MPIYQLPNEPIFPDPYEANADGLLAVGGDLSVKRLIMAYASGIFPWFSNDDPIMWWSPDPRLVLFPDEFKVSKSLAQRIKKRPFSLRVDFAFKEVMLQCQKVPRKEQDGTWITNDMIDAYVNLHEMGLAHSVECWEENKLVGGLYGVSLGDVFFGESMFHKRTDASKIAFYYLSEMAKEYNFSMIDCQVSNPHLISLGAREIPREDFLDKLQTSIHKQTRQGLWMPPKVY